MDEGVLQPQRQQGTQKQNCRNHISDAGCNFAVQYTCMLLLPGCCWLLLPSDAAAAPDAVAAPDAAAVTDVAAANLKKNSWPCSRVIEKTGIFGSI